MKRTMQFLRFLFVLIILEACSVLKMSAQKFYTDAILPFSLNGANGTCAAFGASTPNVITIPVSGVGVLGATKTIAIINVALTDCGTGSKNMNLVSFRVVSPNGICVGIYSGGLSTVASGTHNINLVSTVACLNNPSVSNDAVGGALENVTGNYGFFNAQFNGVQADLTASFNGINADGIWKIIFSETTLSAPCVSGASLKFGNPTIIDRTANGEDCNSAINWIGEPICAMTNSKSGSVLMPGNTSNTSTGTSFGTIGGDTCQWNQANNNDVWIKFEPISEHVCISISGLDFNLQSVIVKDANQDGDNIPCTANLTNGANDQRWELISCPNSAIYSTTAGTQLNQQHCFNAIVNETYYMVVDGNGGAESKFYISGVTGLPATDPCPADLVNFIPDTLGVINSSCNSLGCITSLGQFVPVVGIGACPTGTTPLYSVDNGAWTSTLPIYNQNGPAQSVKVRCSCNADTSVLSQPSPTVTTHPNPCSRTIVNIDTTICEGTYVVVGIHTYSISGTYSDTLVGISVCDSVVHLTLTVTPRIISNLERTICEGSSLTVGTHVYSTGGTYSDTLVSSFGCDSVVHLTLTVTPRIISNLERTICEGSSLTVGTHVYSTSGTYSDTLVSSFGCDSVVHLTLTVTPRIISNLERTICEGSSLTVGTHVYSTGGTYSDTLVSS
ncbi:MAG: hypothetical protein K1X55_16335, partial [Chitinophagales bacterium]|nr:hypothetical protein [Chitinophagales bacterium]